MIESLRPICCHLTTPIPQYPELLFLGGTVSNEGYIWIHVNSCQNETRIYLSSSGDEGQDGETFIVKLPHDGYTAREIKISDVPLPTDEAEVYSREILSIALGFTNGQVGSMLVIWC